MRDERQIKERIEIYEEQIKQWMLDLKEIEDYSVRETYRGFIRRNIEKLEELYFVLELSFGFNFLGIHKW